jgi:hypothetical protein
LTIAVVTHFASFQQHPLRYCNARSKFFECFRQLLLHLYLFGVQGSAGAFKFSVTQPDKNPGALPSGVRQ